MKKFSIFKVGVAIAGIIRPTAFIAAGAFKSAVHLRRPLHSAGVLDYVPRNHLARVSLVAEKRPNEIHSEMEEYLASVLKPHARGAG
jgi:hypothetical protein